MRWWWRATAAALAAGLLATGAAAPAGHVGPVRAATSGAFVLDTLSGGSIHTVRVYRAPLEARILAQWNGGQLMLDVAVTGGGFVQSWFGSGTGEALAVGTFPAATIDGCTGTLTIADLEPALETGVFAAVTRLSASFSRVCGTESTFGEIRLDSDDPYAALGTAGTPVNPAAITMTGAEAAMAGSDTGTSSVTLENLGTVALDLGAAAFVSTPVPAWTLTADTCPGTLAPGATCTIAGHARAWIPRGYQDTLAVPVSTKRGEVRIQAPSMFAASTFVPIDPVRLVDTRSGLGVSSALRSGVARGFTVVDRHPGDTAIDIPPEAVAVTGNLTILKPTSYGWASVTTTPASAPSIRTLHTGTGEVRNNAVVVRLAKDGTLGLTWSGGSGSTAHAVFDATGYFVPTTFAEGLRSGNFRPYGPLRLVDTARGKGISTRLAAGKPRTFTVPLDGVMWGNTAVTGVVTVVRPARAGFLFIGPAPVARPATTALNFTAGESRANTFFAKLSSPSEYGTPKRLSITYAGPAGSYVDVLVDIHGQLGAGGGYGYVPLVPNRVVDSTSGRVLTKPLSANRGRQLAIENRVPSDPSRNLPPDNFVDDGNLLFKQGIVGNLWMVKPTASGVLTAVPPMPLEEPKVSTIRGPAGRRRACTVVLGAANGNAGLQVWYKAAAGSTTHVQFDISGYFVH